MKRLVAISATLFMIMTALSAGAQQDLGPVGVRNQLPFDQLFLGLTPAGAATLSSGRLQLSLSASWSNTFIMSTGIRNWIDDNWKPGRHHLTRADLERIEAASPGMDLFFFDGEILRWNVRLHYGLSNTIELTLDTSVQNRGGGFADSSIESFHDLIDTGNADRWRFLQDHFEVFLKMGDHEYFRDGTPGNTVMGDTSLGLKIRSPHPWLGWLVAGSVAVKAPTGNSNLFGSSGDWDEQVAGYASRKLGPGWLHLNAAYTLIGDIDALPGFETTDLWTFVAGYEVWSPSHTVNWILQMEISSSPFADATNTDLSDPSYLLLIGARIPAGANGYVSFAVIENVFRFDNSTDLALHAGYTVTF
ncbi:MAG: DUF3187 family protein [Acidobacteria bacterium]|nr:DUF3187 family protein [Acidobacteriota bacterium]